MGRRIDLPSLGLSGAFQGLSGDSFALMYMRAGGLGCAYTLFMLSSQFRSMSESICWRRVLDDGRLGTGSPQFITSPFGQGSVQHTYALERYSLLFLIYCASSHFLSDISDAKRIEDAPHIGRRAWTL